MVTYLGVAANTKDTDVEVLVGVVLEVLLDLVRNLHAILLALGQARLSKHGRMHM